MLEKTVDLLRRLVGMQPATDAPSDADRRHRTRYPTNLEITCRPTGGDEVHLTGRLHNISLGGLKVVVNRSFEPGDLLSVELPRGENEPSHTVLACVVHVLPQPNGEWGLGCNFARELSDDDLRAFGARRQRPEKSNDQRGWERFPTDVSASCRLVNELEQPAWAAKVLNISASGVGLLVQQAVPTGALLSVQLRGAHGVVPHDVLACVVHSNTNGDDWALGCNFIRELTDQEMTALV